MTLRTLFGALRRHAVLVVVILVVSTPFYYLVLNAPPSYYARVEVFVLSPRTAAQPNVLSNTRSSVIATAGVVERVLEGDASSTRVTSDDVSLLDMGIESGTVVRLPNTGGQWANNFEQPVLVLEAADTTEKGVRDRVAATTAEIDSVLEEMQRDSGAASSTWMTARATPSTPNVVVAEGRPRRALAYLTALVFGVVGAAVVAAETRRSNIAERGTDRRTGADRHLARHA